MKQHILYIIFFTVTIVSCDKDPYDEYAENLTDEIEKEWHLDSVSVRKGPDERIASEPCVSDDKWIFRYDNTLSYFNNQTEWMLTTVGMACGEQMIFEIREWEITDDTILVIDNINYEIEKLTETEMVLKKPSEILPEPGIDEILLYDYDFFYARTSYISQ